MNTVQNTENGPPTFKVGDKVRAELVGEVYFAQGDFAEGNFIELATGDDPPYIVPLDLSTEGVKVVPADALTPLDVALEITAGKVADFLATAERCLLPDVDRVSLSVEHRVRADAAMDVLVAVLEAAGRSVDPRGDALMLVDAATRKRGGAGSQ